jgi:hypothetical protein
MGTGRNNYYTFHRLFATFLKLLSEHSLLLISGTVNAKLNISYV